MTSVILVATSLVQPVDHEFQAVVHGDCVYNTIFRHKISGVTSGKFKTLQVSYGLVLSFLPASESFLLDGFAKKKFDF